MKKRAIALLLCATLCVSLLGIPAFAADADTAETAGPSSVGDVSVEPVSETIDGDVYEGKLPTGATYFAYIPKNAEYGNRASSNPILIVYGDQAWTKESVKETALKSGLAEIADHEAGPVVFVNPKGETWTAEDVDSYLAVKDLFGDETGNTYDVYNDPANQGRAASTTAEDGTVTLGKYPGTRSRIYVFADGKGADFVYENLAKGVYGAGQYVGNAIWKPVGMFLLNATSEKAVDLKSATAEGYNHVANDSAVESPAVLVNCSAAVKAAIGAVNSPANIEVMVSDAKTLAGARTELLAGYDDLIEHHFTREQGEGVSLMNLRSADQQGFIETKETITVSDGTEVIYYQYIPKNYATYAAGTMPLVLGFHGSGNTAEMFTWSSGWAEVAGKNGVFNNTKE